MGKTLHEKMIDHLLELEGRQFVVVGDQNNDTIIMLETRSHSHKAIYTKERDGNYTLHYGTSEDLDPKAVFHFDKDSDVPLFVKDAPKEQPSKAMEVQEEPQKAIPVEEPAPKANVIPEVEPPPIAALVEEPEKAKEITPELADKIVEFVASNQAAKEEIDKLAILVKPNISPLQAHISEVDMDKLYRRILEKSEFQPDGKVSISTQKHPKFPDHSYVSYDYSNKEGEKVSLVSHEGKVYVWYNSGKPGAKAAATGEVFKLYESSVDTDGTITEYSVEKDLDFKLESIKHRFTAEDEAKAAGEEKPELPKPKPGKPQAGGYGHDKSVPAYFNHEVERNNASKKDSGYRGNNLGALFDISNWSANQFGLSQKDIAAKFEHECGFNPYAVSSTGCTGLGQLSRGAWNDTRFTIKHDFGKRDNNGKVIKETVMERFPSVETEMTDKDGNTKLVTVKINWNDRTDPYANALATCSFTKHNMSLMKTESYTMAYLAHNIGFGGARSFLRDLEDSPSSKVDMDNRLYKLNPINFTRKGKALSHQGALDNMDTMLEIRLEEAERKGYKTDEERESEVKSKNPSKETAQLEEAAISPTLVFNQQQNANNTNISLG